MKVRKSSWHYRLHRYVRQPIPANAEEVTDLFKSSARTEPHLPKSLCGYFWQTAFFVFAYPFVIFALGVAAFFVAIGYGLWWLLIRPFVKLWRWNKHRRRRKKLEKGIAIFEAEPKPPGLVREYLSARKRKVCPLIEVVDE